MANENIIKASADILDLLLPYELLNVDEDLGVCLFGVKNKPVMASLYWTSNTARELMHRNLEKMGITHTAELSPEAAENKVCNLEKLLKCELSKEASEVFACVAERSSVLEDEEVAVATVE